MWFLMAVESITETKVMMVTFVTTFLKTTIMSLVTSAGQTIVLHLHGQIEAEVGSTYQISVL